MLRTLYIGHATPFDSSSSVTLARRCQSTFVLFCLVQFLTAIMPPVGPRAAKDEFMRALNLDPAIPQHEGQYRAMRV